MATPAIDTSFALVVQGITGNRDTSGLKLDVGSAAKGNLTANLTGLPASWTEGFTLFSADISRPQSTGNVLGLEFDGLAASLLAEPIGAGHVFHFNNTPGVYPNAAYTFPAAIALAVSGMAFDAVAFVMDGSGTVIAASNVGSVQVK